jgi:VCBS repeat-containing protein
MPGWDEILKGTSGDDVIIGGSGDDYLQGRAGGDTIDGGAGNDQIHGDDGDDHLRGGQGDDFINGGLGIDTAYYTGSVSEYTFSVASNGNSHISHTGGTQIDGNDWLQHVERLVFGDAIIDLTQNNAPIAADDAASTDEDVGIYSSGSASVLDNDFDWEGDAMSVTSGTFNGVYGTLTINADGTYTYTPYASTQSLAEGASVQDSFNYTVSDGSLTDTGTLTITIGGINDAPVAVADTAATAENDSVTIDVVANDDDVDNGAVLTVIAASAPAGQGSAAIVGNQVEFDPGTDFDYLAVGESVDVVLDYTIEDEHNAQDSSTVTVTVNGTNDAPTIDAGNTDASGEANELPNNDPGENTFVHTDSGSVAFDDVDVSDTHSAGFTPQDVGYLGSFTLDPVDQSGDNVGWDFSVSDADLDSLDEDEVVTQTYTVEIDDGNGGTATQDVTITLTGAADNVPPDGTNWYIDNSAVGSLNNGSPTDPFISIAAFNAAQGTLGGPGIGDNVFLLAGSGIGVYAEADGINLLDGQVLTGVATGLVRPTILTTGAGNHGVELASNNSVSGLDIGTTLGAGISDGNATVGNLTISDVGKSGGGQIIDIDQGGTVSITLNNAASTGSAGGAIDLNGLAGTFTVTGATNIAGVHSNGGVDITGSSLAATFAGGGLVATTSLGQIGVSFTGNTGSLAITGGNFDIVTTSGTALNVQNGGSVSITGGGNNITNTTGTAVILRNVSSTGVTLESVNSQNIGTGSGIILDNAGTGGFTVTGIGSIAQSGGRLNGDNGLDGALTNGIAVYIANTSNVSLSNMVITNTQNFGIFGTNVQNFTLRDSSVNVSHGNNLVLNESAIAFTNLSGIALFEGNIIAGGRTDNLRIVNNTGALDLTIQDSASDQAVMGLNNLNGNDSVFIQTSGSASLTALIDGVDFLGARGDLLEIAALGTSVQDLIIRNNNFTNTHTNTTAGGGGVTLRGSGTGIDVDYQVENNSFTGAVGTALNATYSHSGGDVRGYIDGNVVGVNDGIAGLQGSSTGNGISVGLDRAVGAGTATYQVTIVNNEVYDVGGFAGITLIASGGGALNPAQLEATVQNNIVDQLGEFAFTAFYAMVGGSALSGDFAQLGLDMSDNIFDASDALFGANAVYLDQLSTDAHYYFPGYAGSPDGEGYGGTASVDLSVFLTLAGNVMVNGAFATYPAIGVDASFVTGVTGDPLNELAWFP